jgi:hypothetical protein
VDRSRGHSRETRGSRPTPSAADLVDGPAGGRRSHLVDHGQGLAVRPVCRSTKLASTGWRRSTSSQASSTSGAGRLTYPTAAAALLGQRRKTIALHIGAVSVALAAVALIDPRKGNDLARMVDLLGIFAHKHCLRRDQGRRTPVHGDRVGPPTTHLRTHRRVPTRIDPTTSGVSAALPETLPRCGVEPASAARCQVPSVWPWARRSYPPARFVPAIVGLCASALATGAVPKLGAADGLVTELSSSGSSDCPTRRPCPLPAGQGLASGHAHDSSLRTLGPSPRRIAEP